EGMTRRRNDIFSMPWSGLKRLQEEKLRRFITRNLYPFSPYYRDLFDRNKIRPDSIRTVDDLRRIPFTSKNTFLDVAKEEMTKRNLEFLLQPDENLMKKYMPKSELAKFAFSAMIRGKTYVKDRLEREYRPIFLTATAGTTEQPVTFLYTAHDLNNLRIYGKRIMEIFGVPRDGRMLNVFPYAPHLAFWQTVFAGFEAGIFILSTGGGKALGTEGNIRSILKLKPQYLIGVPSYVYHILKKAKDEGHNLSFLSNIALGAAKVSIGFKRKIASLLAEMGASGVMVLGTYGFTEARCAWVECPTDIEKSSGYHTFPDKEIFEVIDPETGEVKREGEDGELVYTGIDSRGTCVIRYRTGDLVKGGIMYVPCPYCGRTVPRISSDIVRASNVKCLDISKIKGSLVNMNTLEHLLDDMEEIDEWQIEIVKKDNDPYEVDELSLFLSLRKDVDKKLLHDRINDEALSRTEVTFNRIEFVPRDEIQSRIEIESATKAKKIVDKRPKG
ncbi:MAG: AMP-binding protein, partial [Candidatus Omnitrophota bacterium]|nr:AMP-binding protein [Candidatus Omnitrophota bacterium]